MKILALTKYSYDGPSSRYRFYNYRKCFEKNGISMTIKPLFGESYFTAADKVQKARVVVASYTGRLKVVLALLLKPDRYDLLLIEYELFPFMPAFFEYFLKKRGIRYIVDYDDAIFHKYDMSKNAVVKLLLHDKIVQVMKYAGRVIVCNGYLEKYAKKYNRDILRLPTVVLLEQYLHEMDRFRKEDSDTFVIGWIGSKTTSVYILEILPAIKKFVDRHADVRFDLVGFDTSLLTEEQIREYRLNPIAWSEEREIRDILNFDVGIMPLHDDPWSRGKCGFKLVQYMSCKKPVIASPVGINKEIVKDGKNGYLVENIEEWYSAFERLYEDEALRERMAQNNFQKVEEYFNYEKNCVQYINSLKNI